MVESETGTIDRPSVIWLTKPAAHIIVVFRRPLEVPTSLLTMSSDVGGHSTLAVFLYSTPALWMFTVPRWGANLFRLSEYAAMACRHCHGECPEG